MSLSILTITIWMVMVRRMVMDNHTPASDDAGVWPSGLACWLVDFVLAVVGSNPSHG